MFRKNKRLETEPVVIKQAGFAQAMLAFFQGYQDIRPVPPGNLLNPPGNPPVETGNYQFIQDQFFQGAGGFLTDIADIPPAFDNWGQYGINVADPSGQTGGGISNGEQVTLIVENTLFFDPSTGQYYDLGEP